MSRPSAHVVHFPGRMGGQATINASRIPVDLVAGVYWEHGEHEAVTHWEPYVMRDEVLVCCWYMARYGPLPWRRRWADWLGIDRADGADAMLWRTDRHSWNDCPLPPTKDDL